MDNLTAAALADAVDYLLVGKHALAGGTPVDVHLFFIGKTLLEKLNKDPLRPLVVVGIGGIDLAAPVKGDAERLDLLFEAGDIVLGYNLGVNVVLDGIVLGRKSERVPADRIENVVALQPALSRNGIERRVGTRMTDVKSLTRGVRELDESVELFLIAVIKRVEHSLLLPHFLPFRLNSLVIILQFISLQIGLINQYCR